MTTARVGDSLTTSGLQPQPGDVQASGARKGRFWILALKGVASATLMYWIVRDTDLTDVRRIVGSADLWLLLLGVSMSIVGPYVAAQRWRLLLKVQGTHAPMMYLINSLLVAAFVSNFLPSTIGGDAVRVYDSWRLGKSKAGAVAVVFVDRLLGVVALVLLVVLAYPLSREWTGAFTSFLIWDLVLGGAVLVVASFIFFGPHERAMWPLRFLPSRLRGLQDRLVLMLQTFRDQKALIGGALLLSVVLQIVMVAQYYLFAVAIGIDVSFYSLCLVVPMAVLMMMVPISINGIGIRESVLVVLLGGLGIAKTETLAVTWLVYGVGLLQSLFGGIVYSFRK
jgi:uncharacterized protein (TIRG00374 family)